MGRHELGPRDLRDDRVRRAPGARQRHPDRVRPPSIVHPHDRERHGLRWLGLQIVDSQSVYLGIPPSFVELASGSFLGFSQPGVHRARAFSRRPLFLRHTEHGPLHVRDRWQSGGGEARRASGCGCSARSGSALVGVAAAIAGNPDQLRQRGRPTRTPGSGCSCRPTPPPSSARACSGSASSRRSGPRSARSTCRSIGTGLTILNLAGRSSR